MSGHIPFCLSYFLNYVFRMTRLFLPVKITPYHTHLCAKKTFGPTHNNAFIQAVRFHVVCLFSCVFSRVFPLRGVGGSGLRLRFPPRNRGHVDEVPQQNRLDDVMYGAPPTLRGWFIGITRPVPEWAFESGDLPQNLQNKEE